MAFSVYIPGEFQRFSASAQTLIDGYMIAWPKKAPIIYPTEAFEPRAAYDVMACDVIGWFWFIRKDYTGKQHMFFDLTLT